MGSQVYNSLLKIVPIMPTRSGAERANEAIRAVVANLDQGEVDRAKLLEEIKELVTLKNEHIGLIRTYEKESRGQLDEIAELKARLAVAENSIKDQFMAGLRAAKAELVAVGFTGHAVDVVENKIRFEEAAKSRGPS